MVNKKSKNGLILLFPDGRPVQNQEDVNCLRNDFSFTPKTVHKWRLQKIDIEAYAVASSVLFRLGVPTSESILATGPVHLKSFPGVKDSQKAIGVLTIDKLVILFHKKKKEEEFLIVQLANITGLTPFAAWSAAFRFKNGIHIDKDGTFEMEDTYFELDELFNQDGHANRRCVNLMDSLFKTLNEGTFGKRVANK